MRKLAALPTFLLAFFSLASSAETPDAAIRSVLSAQVAAWNRGDIRAFMDGYERSEQTTFVGATITKGHAQVLANYLKRYPTREAMGALTFSGLEIRPLGDAYASVLGHFQLDRPATAGGPKGGIFTLLFRKTPLGWKIILDHTS